MRRKSDEAHELKEEIIRLRAQVRKLKRHIHIEKKSEYVQVSSSLKDLETHTVFERRKIKEPKVTKCQKFLATIRSIVFSHVGLFFILIIYTVIGGVVFQALELDGEKKRIANENKLRGDYLSGNLNLTKKFCTDAERMNILGSIYQKTALDDQFLADSSESLKKYHDGIGYEPKGKQWDIWGALAFCLTIYTAIGYGHIVAATTWGKVLTILYGAVGIPMYLMIMRDWGLIFSKALYAIANALQRYHRTGRFGKSKEGKEDTRKLRHNEEFRVHPVVAILIAFVYMLFGIFIYSPLEDWDYLDTFYFLFHTFVTIGFGDLYPKDSKSFVASFIYIYIGTILIAMTITILRESVADGLEQSHYITARKRAKKISKVSMRDSHSKPSRHSSDVRNNDGTGRGDMVTSGHHHHHHHHRSSNEETHSSPDLLASHHSVKEHHRHSNPERHVAKSKEQRHCSPEKTVVDHRPEKHPLHSKGQRHSSPEKTVVDNRPEKHPLHSKERRHSNPEKHMVQSKENGKENTRTFDKLIQATHVKKKSK